MTRADLGPTWRWIVGVVLTVAFALVGFEVRANADRVATAEVRNADQDVEIGVLKAQAEARGRQLDRIESKLDRLLESGVTR
jgi:hypothetical protein